MFTLSFSPRGVINTWAFAMVGLSFAGTKLEYDGMHSGPFTSARTIYQFQFFIGEMIEANWKLHQN